MSAAGNADGEAVAKEKPLTPRSILRRNKAGRSPANGARQKRVTFEESCLIVSKKTGASGGGRGKLVRRSSTAAQTAHRKKSYSRAASLLLRPQARSMTSTSAVAAVAAAAANDDANIDGLSPPSSVKPYALHEVKAPARARSARNGADLLAGDWCRGIAKGLSGSSSGAGSCSSSGGGGSSGRGRGGLSMPSSRGHRMFQVQEALNRAAATTTTAAAAATASNSSSSSLEVEEGIGSPTSSVSSVDSIGCDDASPGETRVQQLGSRGRSLASASAGNKCRAHHCFPPSPLTALEMAEGEHRGRCGDGDSGSARVAGSTRSVTCTSGGDGDTADAITGAPPAAASAADCPLSTRRREKNRRAASPSSLPKKQQNGFSEQWSGRRLLCSRESAVVGTLEKSGSVEKSSSVVCGGRGQRGSPMRDSRGEAKTPAAVTTREPMYADGAPAAATRLASEGVGSVSCDEDGPAGLLAAGSQSSVSKKVAALEASDLSRSLEAGGEVSLRCGRVSNSASTLITGPAFEVEGGGAVSGSSPRSRSIQSVPVVSPSSDAETLSSSAASATGAVVMVEAASISPGGANVQASERNTSGATEGDVDVKGKGGSEDHNAGVQPLQEQQQERRGQRSEVGGSVEVSELSSSALLSLSADSAGFGSGWGLGPALVEESPLFSSSSTIAAAEAAAEAAATVPRLLGRSDGNRGSLEDHLDAAAACVSSSSSPLRQLTLEEDVDDAVDCSDVSADDDSTDSTSSFASAPAEPFSPPIDSVCSFGEGGDDAPSVIGSGLGLRHSADSSDVKVLGSSGEDVAPSISCSRVQATPETKAEVKETSSNELVFASSEVSPIPAQSENAAGSGLESGGGSDEQAEGVGALARAEASPGAVVVSAAGPESVLEAVSHQLARFEGDSGEGCTTAKPRGRLAERKCVGEGVLQPLRMTRSASKVRDEVREKTVAGSGGGKKARKKSIPLEEGGTGTGESVPAADVAVVVGRGKRKKRGTGKLRSLPSEHALSLGNSGDSGEEMVIVDQEKKPDLSGTSGGPSGSGDFSTGCAEDSAGAREAGVGTVVGEERPRKRGRGRPRKVHPPQDSDASVMASDSSSSSSGRGRFTPVRIASPPAVESRGGCVVTMEVCAGKASLAFGDDEGVRDGGKVRGWMALDCPSRPRFLVGEEINAGAAAAGVAVAGACGSSRPTGRLTVSSSKQGELTSGSASTAGGRFGGGSRRSSSLHGGSTAKTVRRRHKEVEGDQTISRETKRGPWASGWLSPIR